MELNSEDNTNNPPEGGQDILSGPADQIRLDRDQIIYNTPLRESSKDISEAHSDPGRHSRNELLSMNPTVTLEDCHRPQVGGRELQNLASANAPGHTEDFARGSNIRPKRSYVQLKQIYEFSLEKAMEDASDLSWERSDLVFPDAGTGIKSAFMDFKSSADGFIRRHRAQGIITVSRG